MQTQKNYLTLGLASVGIIGSANPAHAAGRAINTIKEVTVASEDTATRIVITGSQSFTPEIKTLGKTGVTMITFPGLWQAGRAGKQSIQKNGIAFVRFGQYAMKPSKQVRIVANYSSKQRKGLKYELTSSEDKTRWEVVLLAPEKEGAEAAELTVTETSHVSLAPIAASPNNANFTMLLHAEKEPLPTIPVRSQRARVSVDIRALTAAASRVVSSTAFAPQITTVPQITTAPQLSLATVLQIAPRNRPLVPTLTNNQNELMPYTSRSAEPRVRVASLAALPPKDRPVSLPEALSAPVALATKPSAPQKRPVVVEAAAPKALASVKLADPSEAKRESAPAASVAQENALDRMVSLDFVNSELADVLKLIAVQARVNIVSGQSIIGKKVTLSLQKVLLKDALDWITRTSGVSYTMEGSNTIIVGTGQEIALLKRTNQTPEATSANIPFFYTDAESLKTALTAAFPNVTLHVIKASEESKKTDEGKQQTPPGDGASFKATGGAAAAGEPTSSMATIKPRGGSLYVVGSRSIIEELRRTIEDMERGLVEIAQRDADRKADQMRGYVNDVYEVKYVNPTEAARLVLESVPNIIIRPGPSQRFIASPLGVGGALAQIGGGMQGGGAQGGGAQGGAQGGGAQGGAQGGGAGGAQGGAQGGMQGGAGLVESRLLLITGKAIDVARAQEMLKNLDVKVPQFIYEARMVEINKDDRDQLGLKYELGRVVNIGENDNGGQSGATVNTIIGGREANGGAIFRTPYSVTAQIDALATKGKANILARPTLSALDGNAAVTFIGDQVPYIISQQQTPTGVNIVTGVANAGIRLQVTGRSNGDGSMTVYVHPEISAITQFVAGLPQISTRFVDTTIRVKNGETIAIGGLVRRQDIDNMRKVPGLGDLPILGQLFRSTDKRVSESEVLIFITCSLSKD